MDYRAGSEVAPREVRTIAGGWIEVPDPDRIVHLQFRRYAGCPICNLHLRRFASRHDEIEAAGIHEIVVFHSTCSELAKYQPNLPFDVVPDPQKVLYREFGVERSARGFDPPQRVVGDRAWTVNVASPPVQPWQAPWPTRRLSHRARRHHRRQ